MPFSFLEIFGVTLAVTNILLDTRQSVLARPLSLLGTGISLYFYYPKGLYAKCLLGCVYIVLHIYGWYQWLYGGKNKTPLQVGTTPRGYLAALIVSGLLAGWGLGTLLSYYSHATLPYWDSLHTAIALVAYWLLVKKKLEAWVVLTLASLLSVVLLYHKKVSLNDLYGFRVDCYITLNIYGYLSWCRSYRLAQAATVFY